MNYRLFLYLLGRLSLTCSFALSIPLIASLYFFETEFWAFFLTLFIAFFCAKTFNRVGEKNRRGRLAIKEAIATVGCGWIFVCFIGALPYYFAGATDFLGAFFESVSGFTTTGVTTANNLRDFSLSLLVWRSMTHWMGGIGVIMLFITVMPQVSGGANYLFHAEIPGPASERTLPKIKESAMVIFLIYVFFTLVSAILLWFAGLDWIRSLTLALASIATGGFSFHYDSLLQFESVGVEIIVAFSMFLSSVNFALYYKLFQKNYKVFFTDPEFKGYLTLIFGGSCLIFLNLFYVGHYDVLDSLRYAVFHTVSIVSTTGFAIHNFSDWPDFSRLVLFILMVIGGCSGSAAGGIKISRIIILAKITWAEIRRSIHPKSVYSIRLGKVNVPPRIVSNVSRFFYMYIAVFAFFSLMISLTGMNFTDSIAMVASCMSNIGPAFGVLSPIETYANISDFGRMIAIAAMLLGRLEIFSLLIILRPDFWHEKQNW